MSKQDPQRLALSIIQFLSASLRDGSLGSDKSDRVAGAGQSSYFLLRTNPPETNLHIAEKIAKSFNIDVADDVQHQQLSLAPITLQSIFDNYLNATSATLTTEVGFQSSTIRVKNRLLTRSS
jgi:hypothetical protein